MYIYLHLCNCGLENHRWLVNHIVPMFVECGSVFSAEHAIFRSMDCNEYSWTSLIQGFIECGQLQHALSLYDKMQQDQIHPSKYTYMILLKAFGRQRCLERSLQLHTEIVTRGLETETFVGNSLVRMYSRYSALQEARKVFDTLENRNWFSWCALIAGYAQHGHGEKALEYFDKMQHEGLSPNEVTLLCSLKACSSIGAIDKGIEMHTQIVREGLHEKYSSIANALVDMYAKCGLLCEAQHVLQGLSSRDTISWSALITGYAQEGHGHEALNCFEGMQNEGLSPNAITFICLLKACGSIGAIDKGKQIHAEIKMKGLLLKKDVALGTALVDMYAKCGALAQAQQVLEELPIRNTLSWSALIAGYAQQGQGYEALKCFHRMQSDGISPDNITFLCVLSACGRAGLLHEAKTLLGEMTIRYGIAASLEHHICMVMVFGCAGHFDDAMSVINTMPSSDHLEAWIVLLGACRKWGNWKLGRLAFDQIMQLDSSCAAAYVLIDNIFLAAGMKEDAKKVEDMKLKYSALTKGKNGVTVEASGTELHLDFLIKRLSLSNT